MVALPINMGPAGYIPQTPTALNTQLIQTVSAIVPDYTAALPGIMIEDMSSTVVYAELQLDSSIAEIISSVSPYAANAYLLTQLGNVYGTPPQPASFTSVYVYFTGTVGFYVPAGFVVGDGTFQYICQEGASCNLGGLTPLILTVATVSGSWAIPENTVTNLITSVPNNITLSVTNPSTGIPAGPPEDETQYRSRVLQAGLAASQGMTRYLKTLLMNVPGVQPNLVSARLITTNSMNWWEIIVGGGDPYAVSDAIFTSGIDLISLTGSIMSVVSISNSNPGVITTLLNHGYQTGQVVYMNGATGPGNSSMSLLNCTPPGPGLSVTVLTQTTFSIQVDTSTYGAYTEGSGVLTPNFRNVVISKYDYPDKYAIPIVIPPQQNVAIVCLWNTFTNNIGSNFVNPNAVAGLTIPAIIEYINTIPVGQPINVFMLNSTFQTAVADLISLSLITKLTWSVSINGIEVAPQEGTGEINGDPESFFYATSATVLVAQG